MPSVAEPGGAAPDVAVAGAGPVGLLLAGELALAGVRVTVLERLARATGESRATHLTAGSMELLDRRGLLGRLGDTGHDRDSHFAGIPVDVTRVPSHRPGLWRVPQPLLERVLGDWAREQGAVIRRGHEVHALSVTPHEVRVGASRTVVRARFLVGCDGEDSTVRRLAGFTLAGTPARRVLYRADLEDVAPAERRLQAYPAGLATVARRAGGRVRIMVHEFAGPSRRGPRRPSFATVAAAWRRVTGEDLGGARPRWLDAFDDAALQVTAYRRGRVLLAGDAAHVQMPIGGQAVNLGLQDAVNLGWKLAAEVRGDAAAGLLDSYHHERHPAARRALRDATAQASVMFGGPAADPLRAVLREIVALPQARDHLAARLSNLDERRLPHAGLRVGAGRTDTTALLHAGRAVLLDLGGDPAVTESLRTAVRACAAPVDLCTAQPDAGGPLDGVGALLARPDGRIAWTSRDGRDPADALGELYHDCLDRRPSTQELR